MIGKNIVVYDLEIKKPIEQCSKGWASKDEMGISVGCAFDYRANRYRVFMDDNLFELVDRLNEPGTLIVAFNHISFDNDLLRQTKIERPDKTIALLKPDAELNNYDMLVVSKKATNADKFCGGFKLDDHLRALGLPLKTANGALAPIWWQEGKIGTVVDYCLNDCMQEKNLFEFIAANRQLACAAFPNKYGVEFPDTNLNKARRRL